MVQSASSTSTGASGRSPTAGKSSARTSGSGTVRQRKSTTSTASRKVGPANSASMWRFYTEDSPGIKVGPVPVLVMSLLFIAIVFMLHIWGKYARS